MRPAPRDVRRRSIVEAARALVAANGAAALNMRDIAREAGVALGTIYLSFPSRTDLLAVLLVDRYDVALAELQALRPSGSVGTDLEAITPVVGSLMELRGQVEGGEQPASGVSEVNRRLLADRVPRVRQAVYGLLATSAERSGRPLADGTEAEELLWLLVLALAEHQSFDGEEPATSLAHFAGTVLLQGMSGAPAA